MWFEVRANSLQLWIKEKDIDTATELAIKVVKEAYNVDIAHYISIGSSDKPHSSYCERDEKYKNVYWYK